VNLFLDTNILIDVLARREPFYAASAAVWTRATTRGSTGWISAISFNNAYYLTRKAAGNEAAKEAVRVLRDAFHVIPLDLSVVDAALASGIEDFEDAIQFVSATRAGSNYLVSRNVTDFPTSDLPVVDPAQLLAVLAASDPPQ
jgi:predicted nucleic acid-binding protein